LLLFVAFFNVSCFITVSFQERLTVVMNETCAPKKLKTTDIHSVCMYICEQLQWYIVPKAVATSFYHFLLSI